MRAFIFILLVSAAAAEFTLDLEKAITRIQGAIAETKAHPPDFSVVPEILEKILPCLGELEGLNVKNPHIPEELVRHIENISPKSVAQHLQKVNWTQISQVNVPIRALEDWDDWKEFMQTTKFEKIHNFLWNNGNNFQYKKILNFIEGAGYPDLFTNIKKFYTDMGRNDMIGDISGTILSHVHHTRNFEVDTFPLATIKSNSIYAEEDECPGGILPVLIEILEIARTANLFQILNVVLYTLQEVLGNPAMHVLMINIGEPATGQAVHELFIMPEMKEFVPLLEHLVFSDDGINQIKEIIKLAAGLDLSNPALFMYVINLAQYLLWGISFP